MEDWSKNAWLVEHATCPAEIGNLLAIADRDLSDCKTQGLSADWKLAIAYNSALQSATAALAACGYRAKRDAHHYRVIQSLSLTVGADASVVRRFEAFRKKRNVSGYDRAGTVSDKEAEEMIGLADEIRAAVHAWLETFHEELLR